MARKELQLWGLQRQKYREFLTAGPEEGHANYHRAGIPLL